MVTLIKTKETVDGLEKKRNRSTLRPMIKQFAESGEDIMEIHYEPLKDYVNVWSCANAWRVACKRTGYNCKVMVRNKKPYIVRVKD